MNKKTITIAIDGFILGCYYLNNERIGMMIRLIMFSKMHNGISYTNLCGLITKNTSLKLDDQEIDEYAKDLIKSFCEYDEKKQRYFIREFEFKNIIIESEDCSTQIYTTKAITKETTPKKTYIKKSERNEKFFIPSLDEVIEYFLVNGYTSETAEKAFKYYSSANWKDSNNRPVTNWKQKMLGVWFKEQYKIKSK